MMDALLSPTAISTSDANSALKQPTYTTAGTLYKPGSSQPLQAPTRRGRSLKWGTGGVPSNLTLFPKSVLASLPLGLGNSQTTPVRYTRLQQNYDRAVSPSGETTPPAPSMSAQPPQMRSGNTPSSISYLFDDGDACKYADADLSDEDEHGSDFGTDPLSNMTVKSLQNLASYPNPNQKRAQKALLRGTKPALSGIATLCSDVSPTPANKPFGYVERMAQRTPSPFLSRPSRSDLLAALQRQGDSHAGSDDKQTPPVEPDNARNQPITANGHNVSPKPASTSLAMGPGAPKPLTAGPPGQRQYRPSTFDTTLKVLQTEVLQQESVSEEEEDEKEEDDNDSFAVALHSDLLARIEGLNLKSAPAVTPFRADESSTPCPPSMELFRDIASNSEQVCSPFGPIGAYAQAYENTGSDDTRSFEAGLGQTKWAFSSSPCGLQLRTQPYRMTDEQIKAHRRKIDRAWYAGAEFLEKTTIDIFEDGAYGQKFKNKFGAIGDGRPRGNNDQSRTIDIAEANSMSVAEHARPLVNMAFASLLHHVQQKSCGSEA